jgi:NAD(P)H-nitrite reductase large subunit
MKRAGSVFVKLDSGDELPADLVICAAGVKPNIAFLAGSGVATDLGVLVDDRLQTNVPGVYAAGDVAEAMDFNTGERGINAIQPNAVDQGRAAALNMVGKETHFVGSLAINVLQTLGLISSSFGKWWGEIDGQSAEVVDADKFRYLSLQFKDDVLIGATSIGLTENVGVLRGLIQGRKHLGEWKDELLRDPTRIMQASLALSVAVGTEAPGVARRAAR